MSASLTYAVGHREVENALRHLCDDLDVRKMISPTEEDLISGGYQPQDDTIETMHKPWEVPKGVLDGTMCIFSEIHGDIFLGVYVLTYINFFLMLLGVERE